MNNIIESILDNQTYTDEEKLKLIITAIESYKNKPFTQSKEIVLMFLRSKEFKKVRRLKKVLNRYYERKDEEQNED